MAERRRTDAARLAMMVRRLRGLGSHWDRLVELLRRAEGIWYGEARISRPSFWSRGVGSSILAGSIGRGDEGAGRKAQPPTDGRVSNILLRTPGPGLWEREGGEELHRAVGFSQLSTPRKGTRILWFPSRLSNPSTNSRAHPNLN